MTHVKHAPGYVPNPDYTQADWDEVCDSPELTAEDFAKARPLAETMPGLVEAMRRQREAGLSPAENRYALPVDRDVVEAYRAGGPGWQGRMHAVLRKAIGL